MTAGGGRVKRIVPDVVVFAMASAAPVGAWLTCLLLLASRQPYLSARPLAVRWLTAGNATAVAQLIAASAWGVLLPESFPAVVFRAACVAAIGIIPSTVLFALIDLWRMRLGAASSEKGD